MASLFISYAHQDMHPTHWVEKLKLYLAPVRRRESVEIWDDSQIGTGREWLPQIDAALGRSTAAILVVGPGFLASDFIHNHELPRLLTSAKQQGTRIYPLVALYCAYLNHLGAYQAFNEPNRPLEALEGPEQNRILNELSLKVDEDLRRQEPVSQPISSLRTAVEQIRGSLDNTHVSFVAQCHRRDDLVAMLRARLNIRDHLQYEKFFFRYFSQMNAEEKFIFDQIRAMTEGPIHDGNQRILNLLEGHPEILEEIPALAMLRQHLVFWLNKYDRVFAVRPEMCLLYAGVEDGVPFPENVDSKVAAWLRNHP